MKIAFIGWGSLFWDSRYLKKKGNWQEDGPLLPIEFARQSERTPLTLVLFPQASDVQTLWTLTKITDLKKAIAALAKREHTKEGYIGYFSRLDKSSRCNVIPDVLSRIKKWTIEKELDGVVWTDLPKKFKVDLTAENEDDSEMEVGTEANKEIVRDIRTDVTEETVSAYISQLSTEEMEKEKNYVTRLHYQIDTKIRKMLRSEFGWRSLTEYAHGFWLDKNIFIMADDAEIKKVPRKSYSIGIQNVEEADMLILTDVVEMIVDDNGKILGEEKRPNLGIWLDAVNEAIAECERKEKTRVLNC
jgi:hypothetical protein